MTVVIDGDRLVVLFLVLTLMGGPKLGLVLFGLLSLYLWQDDVVFGLGRMLEWLLDRL